MTDEDELLIQSAIDTIKTTDLFKDGSWNMDLNITRAVMCLNDVLHGSDYVG